MHSKPPTGEAATKADAVSEAETRDRPRVISRKIAGGSTKLIAAMLAQRDLRAALPKFACEGKRPQINSPTNCKGLTSGHATDCPKLL